MGHEENIQIHLLKDYQRLLCQYHSLQCSINCLQYFILI